MFIRRFSILTPMLGLAVTACAADDGTSPDDSGSDTQDTDSDNDDDPTSDGQDSGSEDETDESGSDTTDDDDATDDSGTDTGTGGDQGTGDTADTSDGGSDTDDGTGTDDGDPDGDDFVEDVAVAVHSEVNTILEVTWNQIRGADQVWLEFTFEGGDVMTSRPKSGELGQHRDVVLGVPGDTVVTIRIVSSVGGTDHPTSDHQGTTDPVPSVIPQPTVMVYEPGLATPEQWMFGAVEDSRGGGQSGYYNSTFWVYIMDRQGRIVWYHADLSSNISTAFPRVARDGEYIWIEKGRIEEGSVIKMTLDWEYYEEIDLPIRDCIDVTDDGSLLYDWDDALYELTSDGETRQIWNCSEHFGQGFQCYSNTVNWNPLDDTVLMSFPGPRTVIEINRQNGEVVGQYGAADGSYAFSPSTWGFGYQHFPNITSDGTLIVSSHMPGYEDTREPVAGQHAFVEFEIDRKNSTLIEKWYYNEGPEWPMWKGMAIRLANGNTLGNYGTGGTIREVTLDKQTAFHVKFDVPDGDDFYNKMVGHNVFVDDLYSLNGGPD